MSYQQFFLDTPTFTYYYMQNYSERLIQYRKFNWKFIVDCFAKMQQNYFLQFQGYKQDRFNSNLQIKNATLYSKLSIMFQWWFSIKYKDTVISFFPEIFVFVLF